ncbi:MAG: eCIS core domain-containing protein, partial [Coleofasciculus sp.]
GVRGFMEPRFGADFSGVRVHTGGEAVQMNQELGAQAFTHGSDVYFGAGKEPGNNELTAHELTHVVQQNGKAVQSQPVFSKQGKESHPEEGEQEQLQAKELSSHISGETVNKELRLQAEQLGQTQTVDRSQIAEEEKLLKQPLGEAEEKAVQMKGIQQRSSLNEITIASSRNAEQKTGNEGTDRLACFCDQNYNMTVVWTLIANRGDRISSYRLWLNFRDGQVRTIPRAPLRARRVVTDQITIQYTQSANIGRVSLTGEAQVGNRETGVRRVLLLPLETYCSFEDNNPNSQENPPQNLPIIWPRWAGFGLPTRSQSRPNVDKVYVGKRLTRTRPGRRDPNLPNQFRRQYNISDGQAVHHLIPLFLGGQDIIGNLVGVWGQNHTRGHSALREQAQLTNYGVSTNLYRHPPGTTYRVAAIS